MLKNFVIWVFFSSLFLASAADARPVVIDGEGEIRSFQCVSTVTFTNKETEENYVVFLFGDSHVEYSESCRELIANHMERGYEPNRKMESVCDPTLPCAR